MFSALTLWTILLPLAPKEEPSPEPPPEGPLEAKLVAKTRTYKLDLQGMTAADFATAAKNGTATAPSVEMSLVLKNNTKSDMRIRTSGLYPKLTWQLTGTWAVTGPTLRQQRVVRTPTAYTVVKPGKSVTISISGLADNISSLSEKRHYWTKAGEYKVSLTARISYSENWNEGGLGGRIRPTYLNLTTNSIPLKITAK